LFRKFKKFKQTRFAQTSKSKMRDDSESKATVKRIFVPLIVALLFAVSVSAEEFKVPAQVEHRGTDSVGSRAAYALKEKIRESQRMALVHTNVQPCIRVLILSVDSDVRDDANYTSAIGTAIVFDSLSVPAGGVFLAFVVNVVGAEKDALFADSLVSHIDEEIERLRRDWPQLYMQLQQPPEHVL
jgi:hypothetical protein